MTWEAVVVFGLGLAAGWRIRKAIFEDAVTDTLDELFVMAAKVSRLDQLTCPECGTGMLTAKKVPFIAVGSQN